MNAFSTPQHNSLNSPDTANRTSGMTTGETFLRAEMLLAYELADNETNPECRAAHLADARYWAQELARCTQTTISDEE